MDLKKIIYSILAVLIAILVYLIIKLIINKTFITTRKLVKEKKKYMTIMQMIINVMKALTIIIAILVVLSINGINIKSILAGIGIVGAVIGLAIQDSLKDLIAGFQIITDDYFAVGDVVEFNGFKGVVTTINLRTTRIKRWDGPELIVNNRNITSIINCSKNNTTAIVDFYIALDSDFDKALNVLTEEFKDYENPLLVEKPMVLGINSNSNKYYTIRVTALTKAEEHYSVQREMLKIGAKALVDNNIKLPSELVTKYE